MGGPEEAVLIDELSFQNKRKYNLERLKNGDTFPNVMIQH